MLLRRRLPWSVMIERGSRKIVVKALHAVPGTRRARVFRKCTQEKGCKSKIDERIIFAEKNGSNRIS